MFSERDGNQGLWIQWVILSLIELERVFRKKNALFV
jgi:hypothetical protein